jgi:hypothetical protein
MKNLIIFCPHLYDYLTASDVISQYNMFNNSKNIFLSNNINVKYFWDFVENETVKENLVDVKKNLSFMKYDAGNHILTAEFFGYKTVGGIFVLFKEVLDNILSNEEYRNSIFWGWECFGFDCLLWEKHYSRIRDFGGKIIMSQYDPHAFYIAHGNSFDGTTHDFADHRFEKTDLIISPSHNYYKNMKHTRYFNKSYFIPHSFNPNVSGLYIFDDKQWVNRTHKIAINGNIANGNAYPERYKLGQMIQKPPLNKFCIVLEYKRYNRWYGGADVDVNGNKIVGDTNESDNSDERGGIKTNRRLSKIKAVFIVFAKFPIDFYLTKVTESLLAGCLCFIEKKEYLKDLGLIANKHYIPIVKDKNGKIIYTNESAKYYEDWLNNPKSIEIARNGYLHCKENFNDHKISEKICNIINTKLIHNKTTKEIEDKTTKEIE